MNNDEEITELCRRNASVNWDSGIDFIKDFVAKYFQERKKWENWPPFCSGVFEALNSEFKKFNRFTTKFYILKICFRYHHVVEGLNPTLLDPNWQENYTQDVIDSYRNELKEEFKEYGEYADQRIKDAKGFKI